MSIKKIFWPLAGKKNNSQAIATTETKKQPSKNIHIKQSANSVTAIIIWIVLGGFFGFVGWFFIAASVAGQGAGAAFGAFGMIPTFIFLGVVFGAIIGMNSK